MSLGNVVMLSAETMLKIVVGLLFREFKGNSSGKFSIQSGKLFLCSASILVEEVTTESLDKRLEQFQ